MEGINNLLHAKEKHRYILRWSDGRELEAIKAAYQWTLNPDLNFGDSDLAAVTEAINQTECVGK